MSTDPSREYSKRLGPITHVQLQAACDRFDLGQLLSAEPAPGGLFGQNILLKTSTNDVVLRGAPHHQWQFAWERYFSREIHERTRAEAPWPYEIEESPELFGWMYAVMPRLPGVSLKAPGVDAALTADDRIGLARALGENLAWMQDATWSAPMRYTPRDELEPLDVPYAEWFVSSTRELLERSRNASDATTDADVAWVEETIAGTERALAGAFRSSIVHSDYQDGNVCVERADDGRWRVTGVFDLGGAYVGDGEYDLARMGSWYGVQSRDLLRAFVGAYAEERPFRPGARERLALYTLHDRLVHWEYGQRNGVWFPAGMCLRDFAEQFVELDIGSP
jgi:aminoglycoside phosphotransferase (APT) family kinase protein